jgi:hypothetical protein
MAYADPIDDTVVFRGGGSQTRDYFLSRSACVFL